MWLIYEFSFLSFHVRCQTLYLIPQAPWSIFIPGTRHQHKFNMGGKGGANAYRASAVRPVLCRNRTRVILPFPLSRAQCILSIRL